MTAISQIAESTREVYSNQDARRILEFLIRNSGTIISPSILQNDEITYPQVESILETASYPTDLLGRMVDGGVLLAELADKVPSCPTCNSKQLSTRYLCPKCFTFDIIQTFLFEHLKCGKVGSDDSFRRGDEFVCPKCQAVLHEFGVEYRSVGAWYKCNRCDHTFNSPIHSHFCRSQHHEFSPDRLRLVSIFQYRLNPDSLEEIRRNVLVYSEAITLLENLGLTVMAPQSLPGKSGRSHSFDIVLTQSKKGWRSEEKTMAIDIIVGAAPVGTDAVKGFNAKVRDVKLSESWLITVPSLSDDARVLIGNLRLSHVEGATLQEAMVSFQAKSNLKPYETK